MNYSTAVFLINDKVRAVQGTYEAGETASKTMFKTFNPNLKVGDFAIVPTNTRHNMTVVKITDVDVEFDIETGLKFEWVIGAIDLSAYEQVLAQEQEAVKTIQSAEKTRKRAALREAIFADAETQLNKLPIAAIGHDAAITS
jgi:hypothetical protein